MASALPTTFAHVFEDGPAAYIILNSDAPIFTILDVNKTYLKLTHTRKDEIVGKGMFEIFPGNPKEINEGSDLLKESLLNVIALKEAQKMPMHRYDIFDPKKGDYTQKYWTGINTPLLSDDAQVSCIIHSPLDVTYTYELSRKEKEVVRALHQQRNDLFAVFKYAPVGIGIFRGNELFVELANDELCHLLGVQQKEIVENSIYEIMRRVGGDDFLEIIRSSLNSNNPFVGYELPLHVMRNGIAQEIYINFAYEKIRDTDGNQTGVIVVANDVTAQVVTRKKLEESEQRLNMAITASNMGVWDTDLVTRKSIRSMRHAEIFGYADNSGEWNLDIMFSHVLPEDLDRLKREHLKAYENGLFNTQFRIKTCDDKIKWIHVMGEVQRDARGNPIRMLGTVTDITGNKELEKLKDEFISTVSHEIKTPVTSIKAYGQILQRKMLQQENHENVFFLKKIDSQINRLTDLVHHLLDATRIDNNKLKLNPVSFDLNNLASEIIDEIQLISPNHKLNFSPCQQSQIFGDVERIRQVIVNMLTNALKYSPKADKVDIFTYNKDSFAFLCVRDYGIGIPYLQQERIFDRFFQADERANTAPGLGLGLYISHEIIVRQNGEMWVESTPNKGSDFYFKLPLQDKV